MWIPNDPVFTGYMQFAQVVSVFFLSYQAVLLLVVFYLINGYLVNKLKAQGNTAGTPAGVCLIVLSLLLLGGNIAWIVMQFIEFGECTNNAVIMAITAAFAVVSLVLVCLRTREDASVLTSLMVTTYCLYMQWSAMSSQEEGSCNKYTFNTANTDCMIVFGSLFTFIALFTIASSEKDSSEEHVAQDANALLLEEEGEPEGKVADEEGMDSSG